MKVHDVRYPCGRHRSFSDKNSKLAISASVSCDRVLTSLKKQSWIPSMSADFSNEYLSQQRNADCNRIRIRTVRSYRCSLVWQ
jgi:hypothetical protein